MLWMQESPERSGLEAVASYSPILGCMMHWAQWKSLRVQNGILYRLWESPTEDERVRQLVLG